jgi:hypothetical protein
MLNFSENEKKGTDAVISGGIGLKVSSLKREKL